MAITMVVYSFDKVPQAADILFYLGHIEAYSDVPIRGKVLEGPHLDGPPYYNILRMEDEVIEDDNLYVLFAFSETTDEVVSGDEALYLPRGSENIVTSEVADWMMMINGTKMRHYSTTNGNFLFVLKGSGGEVNSMFCKGRRRNMKLVEDV